VGGAEIRIENARTHNLQSVSCRIPLYRLTVVTGVSGSGKSSLAFDTLYAEGQRRYVTSLSTYARQFLERLARPDVDHVSNLPPAIAIEQRNPVTQARSTVGTATEILDALRLLYAHIGQTWCPDCNRSVSPGTVEAVSERIQARFAGGRVSLGVPVARRPGESLAGLSERLMREGYGRLLDAGGQVVELSETPARGLGSLVRDGLVLIDRLAVRGSSTRARIAEGVATAFQRGASELIVLGEAGERARYQEAFACDGCGRCFPRPVPALFSFNSPLGACPACQGFGRISALDLERVIPDPDRTLEEGAVAPFATRTGRRAQRKLREACRRHGIPMDRPWRLLSRKQQRVVVDGDAEAWTGVRGFFRRLERKRYKVQTRVMIARYRCFQACPECRELRLQPDSLQVRIASRSIGDVSMLSIRELDAWLGALRPSPKELARCGRLLEILQRRVATALEVGLGYLSLLRQVRTLSGGEAQRIQLASALGGTLTSALYVLDEPSVGLHPRDAARLLSVLRGVRDQGNTVVVVEHDPEIVASADHVIDLGPGAGRLGGRLVVEGPVAAVRAETMSATGQALRGELVMRRPGRRRRRGPRLRVFGARANNLQNLDVGIPLEQLVVVTGVSGAGKSSLVRSVVVGQLRREPERGACDRLEGAELVTDVVVVDSSVPARSPRSNPGTVSKAFDRIRERFAATREARALGLRPGWFSFNVAGGRCESCEGAGEVVVDMQFLEDVRVPCDACRGTRYRPEARSLHLEGRSIVEVLGLTLDEACEVFATDARIRTRLEPFRRAGLGYLTLGQPLSTLSGGEVQRLRLALALAAESPGVLYVLDEPTTGLHPRDIQGLLACLDALLDQGGSVLVVEHNLDVIRVADHVIDLGPEGGPGGGRVVATGTPAAIARVAGSLTGAALRAGLGTARPSVQTGLR